MHPARNRNGNNSAQKGNMSQITAKYHFCTINAGIFSTPSAILCNNGNIFIRSFIRRYIKQLLCERKYTEYMLIGKSIIGLDAQQSANIPFIIFITTIGYVQFIIPAFMHKSYSSKKKTQHKLI